MVTTTNNGSPEPPHPHRRVGRSSTVWQRGLPHIDTQRPTTTTRMSTNLSFLFSIKIIPFSKKLGTSRNPLRGHFSKICLCLEDTYYYSSVYYILHNLVGYRRERQQSLSATDTDSDSPELDSLRSAVFSLTLVVESLFLNMEYNQNPNQVGVHHHVVYTACSSCMLSL